MQLVVVVVVVVDVVAVVVAVTADVVAVVVVVVVVVVPLILEARPAAATRQRRDHHSLEASRRAGCSDRARARVAFLSLLSFLLLLSFLTREPGPAPSLGSPLGGLQRPRARVLWLVVVLWVRCIFGL